MSLSITEFSVNTGLSAHTLRFYEKQQLLTPKRTKNNYRYYTNEDIEWARCIIYLKETGMSIKQIQQFAFLRSKGESTYADRMKLLTQHNKFVKTQIKTWRIHQKKLNDKINYYRKAITCI